MRRLSLALTLMAAACGGSTPAPDVAPGGSDGVAFQNGDVLSYVLVDASGRTIGRSHSKVARSDGQLKMITRVAYGEPAGATVEYASTLRDDFTLVAFKRLSSAEGRLQLDAKGGFLSIVTDIAQKKVPYETSSRAMILSRDDFLALAAAIRHSGMKPGTGGQLERRVAETGEVESVPVQVYADASRQTIVKLPDGTATLDGRGYVKTYERSDGSKYTLEATPSEPPRLLAVPQPAHYERPRGATWDDVEVTIDVPNGRYAGVLSVPKLRSKWPSSLAPGVIVLSDLPESNRHGFGNAIDYGRWEMFDRLADDGFAVLRLDDRGVGSSRTEVEPSTMTVQDRVADAEALYDFLKRQPDVDPDKIIVIGHGFGAIDAVMLAQRTSLTALVLIAPPFRSVPRVLAEREMKLHETPELEAERRMNLLLAVFKGNASAQAQIPDRIVELYRHAKARILTASEIDLAQALVKVDEPIAVFQGLKDFETSWKHDAQALEGSVNKRKRRQAKLFVYADADHLLKTTNSTSTLETYADRGRRLVTKALDDLSEWLTSVAK